MKKVINFFVEIVSFIIIMSMGLFFLIAHLFVSFVLPVQVLLKESLSSNNSLENF